MLMFVLGMVTGAAIGVFCMSLLIAAGQSDRHAGKIFEQRQHSDDKY